jgi:hypothetical protein
VLPVGWLILAVVVAVVVSMWVTFTLTRLDRLHARVDATWASLDAQLVRRSAALQHVAEAPDTGVDPALRAHFEAVAKAALNSGEPHRRQTVENAVGRAVADLAEAPQPIAVEPLAELREAAARVMVARRFYNDAVRDTRALRARRMPRLLRLAGHVELPQFFDIDDTVPIDTVPINVAPPPVARRPVTDPPPVGSQPEIPMTDSEQTTS